MDNWPNERRESFRIDMQAYVKVMPSDNARINPEDYFSELKSMALVSELKALDNDYFFVSERIKDLAAKKSVDLLQQKVNILSQLMVHQTLEEQSLSAQTINISEGGCLFHSDTRYATGQKLAIAIAFQANFFTLFSFADVVESPPESNDLHLQFSGLTERQQQQLIKHMFQAQTDSKKQQGVL